MRVIAGSARRTILTAPEGLNTRPTSDRAKESLFSILGEKIRDAHVLDIFCGSGAIGIEALSRGAAKAVFVDNSAAAIKATQANLSKTRLAGEVLQLNATKAIQKLSADSRAFDIIFLDPPYDTNLLTQTLEALSGFGLLDEGCLIIAETDSKESPQIPAAFAVESTRIYGRTKFIFFNTRA